MKNPAQSWLRHFPLAIGLCLLLGAGSTEHVGPMTPLTSDEADRWSAVGRINTRGFWYNRGCSATLIAPDLVITAAHCANARPGSKKQRHFVAGWFKGRFKAHRITEATSVHPIYRYRKGKDKFPYDLALLRLADPIPTGLVEPIPLAPPVDNPEPRALLLGYENRNPDTLGAHKDCPLLGDVPDKWSIFGCEVVHGTSGGAVLVESEDGWALRAVIVGRQGQHGDAIVVGPDAWVRDAWHDALDRAAKRP